MPYPNELTRDKLKIIFIVYTKYTWRQMQMQRVHEISGLLVFMEMRNQSQNEY